MSNQLPTNSDTSGREALSPQPPSDLPMGQAFDVAPERRDGFNWRRYLSALVRYKWLVVALIAAGAVAGLVATRFVKIEYVARATIWIESTPLDQQSRQGPIRSAELLESYAWVELLRSFVVLDEVVHDLRLYLEPRSEGASAALASFSLGAPFQPGEYRLVVNDGGYGYTLMSRAGTVLERGAVGDSVGLSLGFRWAPGAAVLPPGSAIEFGVATPRDAAQRILGELTARTVGERGNFLRLTLRGTEPARLATVLNAVADRFVDAAAELKRAKLEELTQILSEQLQMASGNLEEAEVALESFRVQTITLPSEPAMPVAPGIEYTRNPVFSSFFEMKVEQEQMRRDRESIQRALAESQRSGLAVAALEVIGAVRQSSELSQALQELTTRRAELRAVRHQYTDEHPTVRRLIAQIDTLENRAVPRLASALIGDLRVRESELGGLVQSVSGELQQIPPRAIEEARLRRQVTTAENLYTILRSRYEEARLAAASTIPDVRVLDRATVPRHPDRDERPRILFLALMGSLGLAVMGAIVLDRIDPRVRYPEQITDDLGLAILGAVPHVRHRNGRTDMENTALVIEAFRTIRLNLVHAFTSSGPLVVTVTSPGTGDGKSFISTNLALAFAEQGQRVLLIDGDIRQGGLHRLFNVNRKPGLTDFLAGAAGRDVIVQKTSYPALHMIGCGTRMQSGPELLSTPAMKELIATMRSLYSVVVVDTPPLGAGVDPFVFGTVTGHLLLVLRSGETNREFAGAKLELLDRLPIRVLGAVLNDTSPGGFANYYFRQYAYLPGYEVQEEPELAARGRLPAGS